MDSLKGWYYGSDCSTVGGIIQELKNFDSSYVPTILEEYIQPIHHVEFYEDDIACVYFVLDASEPDVYIESVEELISELSKFDEEEGVLVRSGNFSTSIDFVMDYILDVNSLGDESFIPFNVSFLTTAHCMF